MHSQGDVATRMGIERTHRRQRRGRSWSSTGDCESCSIGSELQTLQCVRQRVCGNADGNHLILMWGCMWGIKVHQKQASLLEATALSVLFRMECALGLTFEVTSSEEYSNLNKGRSHWFKDRPARCKLASNSALPQP